jgi:transcriptional regulator with XRE-family HTH domain
LGWIENDKTDPSFSTIGKIAKAMKCNLAELFGYGEEIKDINSIDKSVVEKVSILEILEDSCNNQSFGVERQAFLS